MAPDILANFRESLRDEGRRAATIDTYIGAAHEFLEFSKDRPFSSRPENVEAFLRKKREDGIGGTRRLTLFYALKKLMRFLNPNFEKFKFKAPSRERHLQPSFEYTAVEQMLERSRGNRGDWLLLRTLFATAMRREEVVRYRLGDLKFLPEGPIIEVRGKTGPRLVPIDEETARELKKERSSPFPKNASAVTRIVNWYAEKCGVRVPRTGSHALRRAVATYLHEQGMDLRQLQAILGHRNLHTYRRLHPFAKGAKK